MDEAAPQGFGADSEPPYGDDTGPVEVEIPAVTAPVLPYEIVLHNSTTWYQRMIGGGMQLRFAPLVQTPSGYVPTTPGLVIEFSPDAWERFKAEAAADGDKPRIETVRHFPGGPLNGGLGG